MSIRRRILLSPGSKGQDPSPPPSRQVPSHVIIAVVTTAAASLFLALIYYAVLRHRRRRPLSHITHASASSGDPADHPIWHIKTVGLDDAAIASLGSYAYSSPAAAGDPTAERSCSCSVCLGELLDGDTVRLLPKCGHVFHVQCIDTWLRCHVSCPLCRTDVVDPCPAAAAPAATDDAAVVEESSAESNPTQSDEGGGQEGEGESEAAGVRVLVEIPPESSEALRSISMDLEKDQEGLEMDKGQSESGRSFLFSRLGRARSSSVLPF